MKDREKLLGLVGHQRGGKDTVGDYLRLHYGFDHTSSGNMIREYVKDNKLGDPDDRDVLILEGNKLRAKYGGDVLVKMAIERETSKLGLAISGLRAIPEVEAILAAGGEIWAVEALAEIRYIRARESGRISQTMSLEDFKLAEEREEQNEDRNAQNVGLVVGMAKYVLNNNGTFEELYGLVDELMKS